MLRPVLSYDLLFSDMQTALLDAVFIDTTIGTDTYGDYTTSDPVRQANGEMAVRISTVMPPIETIEVLYRRLCISEVVGGRSMVLQMTLDWHVAPTVEQIQHAIEEQYGVILDTGHFVVEDLVGFDYDQFYRCTVRILDTHLTLEGSVAVQITPTVTIRSHQVSKRLAIMSHYADYYDDPRFPVELLLRESDLQIESTLLGHPDVDLITIADVLHAHTQDDWNVSDYHTEFNLHGAEIVYNGVVQSEPGCASQWGCVLVLDLSEQCANLKGRMVIHYREPKHTSPVRILYK